MRWTYYYLALACILTGIWLTQTEPWWFAAPLYISALCLGLLAKETE